MGLLEAHAGLAGKVAVVVGGAGGFMGRGITLALAQAGVHIAACDNDDEAVRTIVPDVEALGSRILSVRADVTDADTLHAFYDRVAAVLYLGIWNAVSTYVAFAVKGKRFHAFSSPV